MMDLIITKAFRSVFSAQYNEYVETALDPGISVIRMICPFFVVADCFAQIK